MEVNVEWTGRNKAGALLHKSSDTKLSDEFDPVEDREKINNMLKKEIAEFYQVDRDSISLLKVNIAEAPTPVAISKDELNNVLDKNNEYNIFIDSLNNNIDVKITSIQKEIDNLIFLKNRFENLKQRINKREE